MWKELPEDSKDLYREYIKGFASLTPIFSQKAGRDSKLTPYVVSKFQEGAFNRAFGAMEEDIGNTSFDSSLIQKLKDGQEKRYVIGIKTFRYGSGMQKIAQFKKDSRAWTDYFKEIENIAKSCKSKEEINEKCKNLYLLIAKKIAIIRNQRIDSSIAQLKGFKAKDGVFVESIYHVLKTKDKNFDYGIIEVGETSYSKINIDNITILGCSDVKKSDSFSFKDSNHSYKYTKVDSQLYMEFDKPNIGLEEWEIKYLDNPWDVILGLGNKNYSSNLENSMVPKQSEHIVQSFIWRIDVHPSSGFNAFYGTGSKMAKNERQRKINYIENKYNKFKEDTDLNFIVDSMKQYFGYSSNSDEIRKKKIEIRDSVFSVATQYGEELSNHVKKALYRPVAEMYIPIPNSRKFHEKYPTFFTATPIRFDNKGSILTKKEQRTFTLQFEPSGDQIEAYICQQNGKAIQSTGSQEILGEWILRKVFCLKEMELLTEEKLIELGINSMYIYRTEEDNNVHLKFIWMDTENK